MLEETSKRYRSTPLSCMEKDASADENYSLYLWMELPAKEGGFQASVTSVADTRIDDGSL